jgi:lipooligosaccharide transport system permease protein
MATLTWTDLIAPGRREPRPGAPRAMVERNLLIYRHTWYVLIAEILEPVLYLLCFGLGVGTMIGHVAGTAPGISFGRFVAPGLLTTSAMNGAMNETTYNMFAKLRTDRTYESILTTPMSVRSVARGEIAWALLRGTIVASTFLAFLAVIGYVRTPLVLLDLPATVLIGFSFASAGLAVVTFMRNWQDFQLIQLVMLPMFLFSTTFYPVGVYPRPIQFLVECLPLYQAITLVRGPFLGSASWALLGPVVYLAVFGLLGLALAQRRLGATLAR